MVLHVNEYLTLNKQNKEKPEKTDKKLKLQQ